MKPRLVQILCGPQRHAILACPYAPGVTVSTLPNGGDLTLTEQNAADYARALIDGAIRLKLINPWCEICKSPREQWSFEDNALAFATLEEAMPYLKQLEREQMETARFLKASRQ